MSASRAFVCSVALVLAACKGQPPAPHARETDVPADLAPLPAPPNVAGAGPGTPLKDRVATLGILNKRNNLTEDVQLKPGESRRWGDVIVRLESSAQRIGEMLYAAVDAGVAPPPEGA